MVQDTHNLLDPNAVRQSWLDFFAQKKHLVYPSASLKSDDPHLMFNVAGMQQFKPYFQGATPKFPGVSGVWPRVATSQKCMRAGGKDSDIENVGRTRRHHTFFEMLGNFSFGDYFKRDAILWAWEFLTSPAWLGLEPERLYATVFNDDDEAYDIWLNEVNIPAARLSRWGEGENFWPANAITDERNGPCGPCSEIFYDRGPDYGTPDETGPNTGSGDRYVEIWNLVFTQFNLEGGVLTPLPQKNIDTGAGLERLASIMADAPDAYSTPLFTPIISRLVALTGVPYEDSKSVPQRIIADHVRSVSMCITDGILPANDGAGYVIKMLIRRAARQAYLLGLREPVLHKLVAGVVEAMGAAYPEVAAAQTRIEGILEAEESLFLRTLESGIERVTQLLDTLEGDELPGEVAFDLWQTYGFPLSLTQDMAAERGVRVDTQGYEAARQHARETSRAAQAEGAVFAAQDALGELETEFGASRFVGYKQREASSTVLAVVADGLRREAAAEGSSPQLILSPTPFYAEGGGQVGDGGVLEWQGGKAMIVKTSKTKGGLFVHQARILRGTLNAGAVVRAVVDPSRDATEKHHTATHLLHAALRSVLGAHVAQAGSLVNAEHLRFDFSHPKALSEGEKQQIETLINRWIQRDFEVSWQETDIESARQAGAMMLFGEKYGDSVRMVSVGSDENGGVAGSGGAAGNSAVISRELCGGCHVARTGTLGVFLIDSEEAVSAGVRRITALAGEAALANLSALRSSVNEVSKALGVKPADVAQRVTRLQQDLKQAGRDNAGLKDKLAAAQTGASSHQETKQAAGYSYNALVLEGLDAGALRNAADTMLQKGDLDFVVLASGPLLVIKVTDAAQAKGLHAGKLIGNVARRAGGGGGGKPNLAQAGVKDASKLQLALDAIPEILASA